MPRVSDDRLAWLTAQAARQENHRDFTLPTGDLRGLLADLASSRADNARYIADLIDARAEVARLAAENARLREVARRLRDLLRERFPMRAEPEGNGYSYSCPMCGRRCPVYGHAKDIPHTDRCATWGVDAVQLDRTPEEVGGNA
jgi:hypothetical protein